MSRFLLLIAVLALSTAAPLIRYAAPAPPLTVAAGRACLVGLLLWAVAPRAWHLFAGLDRRERALILAAGLMLGAHFGVWITSLYFTTITASVALMATQPVFAALFARALGDTIQRREVAGMAIASLGFLALGGGDLAAGSTGALFGDLLALLGAITAAGYLLLGRRLRGSMPLMPYLAVVNMVAGVSLLAAALLAGSPVLGFDGHVYLAIMMAAVVPSLIGHTLLNWSVRRTPAHLVTLAVLGEPVGASLLTWVAFAEVPPVHAMAGGVVILAGISIGFRAGQA